MKKAVRLAACVIFYLLFLFADGAVLGADSRGYIEMIAAREPVYPLFLAAFRCLFNNGAELFAAAFIQSLLQGLAVFLTVDYVREKFQVPLVPEILMYLTHAGAALLIRFASERGAVFSTMIMTEGITMSLWLIFMVLLFKAVYSEKYRDLYWVPLLLAIMFDTRKQMAAGYVIFVIVIFFTGIRRFEKKKWLKRTALALGLSMLSIIVAVAGTRLYNLMLRGEFAQNTRDMNLVLTTTLYVADEDDGRLIDDPAAKEVFDETVKSLKSSESNISFAPSDLSGLAEHYEEHYDVITIDTTKDLFEDNAVKRGFAPGMEAQKEADRMSAVIVKSLMTDNLTKYMKIYAASLLTGFVNTIAHRNRFLNIVAFALYAAYIFMLIKCYRKKELRDTADTALTVLIAIAVNTGVTAAVIFCQSRYMIYNMAIFYMLFILMGFNLWGSGFKNEGIKRHNKKA